MADISRQAYNVLRQIIHVEPHMLKAVQRQAEDVLKAYGRGIEVAPEIENAMPSLAIILLDKLEGKKVVLNMDEFDKIAGEYNMGFQLVSMEDKTVEFSLQKKGY